MSSVVFDDWITNIEWKNLVHKKLSYTASWVQDIVRLAALQYVSKSLCKRNLTLESIGSGSWKQLADHRSCCYLAVLGVWMSRIEKNQLKTTLSAKKEEAITSIFQFHLTHSWKRHSFKDWTVTPPKKLLKNDWIFTMNITPLFREVNGCLLYIFCNNTL